MRTTGPYPIGWRVRYQLDKKNLEYSLEAKDDDLGQLATRHRDWLSLQSLNSN